MLWRSRDLRTAKNGSGKEVDAQRPGVRQSEEAGISILYSEAIRHVLKISLSSEGGRRHVAHSHITLREDLEDIRSMS
jgi:hypothetical protein